MSTTSEPTQKPSFLRRLWRFTVRLLFVVLLGIVIGGLLYWFVPALYRQYIQPVQEYGLRLDALEAEQEMSETQLEESLSSFQERLGSLESQQDANKQEIAVLGDRLEGYQTAAATQQAGIESLQSLAQEFADAEINLADFQQQLEELQAAQRRLQAGLKEEQDNLAALEEDMNSQQSQVDELDQVITQVDGRWLSLQQDLQMVKAMELLSRARFYLSQSNLGLARSDIQSARGVFLALQEDTTGQRAEEIERIIAFLDDALVAMPRSSLRAADALEGAWLLVIQSMPSETAEPTLESVEATPTPTATPTP
jgi:predicted RNase H-like nuclease (RuvC/YqgF family)